MPQEPGMNSLRPCHAKAARAFERGRRAPAVTTAIASFNAENDGFTDNVTRLALKVT